MVLIRASVCRAIMESSVDLPTPDPEKIPMRWPRQQVRNAFMERTPRSIFSPMRWRACEGGGWLWIG